MINTHLSILHLPKRTDRMDNLMKELSEQEITDYTIVEGFQDLAAVFRGISMSHKSIIRMAKYQGMPNCIVAEDDICFYGKGAWKYYLEQLELNKDADIFFGMVYQGKINEENKLVIGNDASELLSGLSLYSVNAKFYDVFQSVIDMDHIDKSIGALCDKYDFRVCNPFVCKQMDGFSDNKKMDCKYDHYLIGRKLFGVNTVNPKVH